MQQEGHDIHEENLHRDNAAEVVMRWLQRLANSVVRTWLRLVGATYMSPAGRQSAETGDMYVAPTKGI
ncbi:MAG: hypothetical protein QM754_12375 [Tepidisphaeraceae bacterium]